MKPLLFVFDFDETLFNWQGQSLPTFTWFKLVLEQGHEVLILTGRYPEQKPELSALLIASGVEFPHERMICVTPIGDIAESKVRELKKLVLEFEKIEYWDDDPRNIQAASRLKGIVTHHVKPFKEHMYGW